MTEWKDINTRPRVEKKMDKANTPPIRFRQVHLYIPFFLPGLTQAP